MKKFGLLLLITCIGFFAACSDDEKPEPTPDDNATAVAGTYSGDIAVTLPGGTGIPTITSGDIVVERTGDNIVQLKIEKPTIIVPLPKDIVLKDVTINKNGSNYSIVSEEQTLDLLEEEGALVAKVKVINGEFKNGNMIVKLSILTSGTAGLDFTEPIIVEIDALKAGEKSSKAAITKITFDSDVIIGESSINEESGEVTLYVKDDATAEALKEVPVAIEVSKGATVNPASGSKVDLSKELKFVVTAEDGETTKEYTVKTTTRNITFFDFEEWEAVNPKSKEEQQYFAPTPIDMWASSNDGLKLLASNFGYKYPTKSTTDTPSGKGLAAEVGTLMLGTEEGDVFPNITAGSLFTGKFKLSFSDLSNPLRATKFGVPFDKKPIMLNGYYKYKPGEEFHRAHPGEKGKTVVEPNTIDKCSINAILYEISSDDDEYITGSGTYDDERIVAEVRFESGEVKEYTKFSEEFKYREGKTYDASKKYRIAIILSSSKDGDTFSGAPGSTLYVDDIEIISE